MQILSLSLRGAIGIRKGLNLPEIFINFSQIPTGLIAFVGPNGTGKTTIIENLHPFRTLISREGKLQDHFELKDSHKILKFKLGDSVYECKVLIDGITGASEAYLYENDVPMNDGKVTTYDQQIERIIGSETLFFNSVFCAQKSKGFAQLKESERRKLFYELLNLNKYESLCAITRKKLTAQELKLAGVTGEIKSLTEEAENISITKPMIAEKIYEREAFEKNIKSAREALTNLRNSCMLLNKEIADINNKISKNTEIKERAAALRLTIRDLEVETNNKLSELETVNQKIIKEFEDGVDKKSEVRNLEQEIIVTKEKADIAEKEIKEKISLLEMENTAIEAEILSLRKRIARNEKIKENKSIIDAAIISKKDYTIKINAQLLKEKEITETKKHYDDKRNSLDKDLSATQNKRELLVKDSYNAKKELERIKQELDNYQQAKTENIQRMDADIAIIENVPCDEQTGSGCQFLKNAYEIKARKSAVIAEYEKREIEYYSAIDEIEKTIGKLQNTEQELLSKHNIIKIDRDSYDPLIEVENIKLEEVGKEIKELSSKLAELNKNDWETLQKDAELAESAITIDENNIQSKMAVTQSKADALNQNYKILEQHNVSLANSLQRIEDQKKAIITRNDEEYRRILEDGAAKKQQVRKDYGIRINEKTTEAELLEKSIDVKIDAMLTLKENELRYVTEDITGLERGIEKIQEEEKLLIQNIQEMETKFSRKIHNLDLVKEKEAAMIFIQKNIKEYDFLVRAFDKTGIPVLKFENSSYEVTKMTNELLSLYENPFRIRIETKKTSADGKKMIEAFLIKVIDDKDECDISNKSGGEQVWTETAITNSIGAIVRRQGKHIATAFADEKDGALDTINAYHYVDALLQAHKISNLHHTFMITHSSELKEIIPNQIVLSKKNGIEIIKEDISK